jgi:hypothetical protein
MNDIEAKALALDGALRQPTQSDTPKRTPVWTEAATIQANGFWEGNIARPTQSKQTT